jgi:hypothetical protein
LLLDAAGYNEGDKLRSSLSHRDDIEASYRPWSFAARLR